MPARYPIVAAGAATWRKGAEAAPTGRRLPGRQSPRRASPRFAFLLCAEMSPVCALQQPAQPLLPKPSPSAASSQLPRAPSAPAGLRSLIVTPLPNLTAETPLIPPPAGVAGPTDTWVAFPDTRRLAPMVAALRLAPSAFGGGSFSWLLSGDDDTVFVTENVISLLRRLRLDPSVPYYITDDQASACLCALRSSAPRLMPRLPIERGSRSHAARRRTGVPAESPHPPAGRRRPLPLRQPPRGLVVPSREFPRGIPRLSGRRHRFGRRWRRRRRQRQRDVRPAPGGVTLHPGGPGGPAGVPRVRGERAVVLRGVRGGVQPRTDRGGWGGGVARGGGGRRGGRGRRRGRGGAAILSAGRAPPPASFSPFPRCWLGLPPSFSCPPQRRPTPPSSPPPRPAAGGDLAGRLRPDQPLARQRHGRAAAKERENALLPVPLWPAPGSGAGGLRGRGREGPRRVCAGRRVQGARPYAAAAGRP